MKEEYAHIPPVRQGYYSQLGLQPYDIVMVQNLDNYNKLKELSEKDHKDTSARWEIDNNWIHCIFTEDEGLLPVRNDQDLPDSPVICVILSPAINNKDNSNQ